MQRYRVNYTLLIGLVVGSLVASGGGYFLWRYQINRSANWYQERAEKQLADGDPREALRYQSMFVQLRPEEDAKKRRTEIALAVLELPDAENEDIGTAYAYLDKAVRETGDSELRRKLVDMQLDVIRRPGDAETNLRDLLKEDPNNTELMGLRAKALFQAKDYRAAVPYAMELIGYDKKASAFDESKAKAPKEAEVYGLLAAHVLTREEDAELAEQIIQRMVEVNPDSHVAYVKQALLLRSQDKLDESRVALDRAYELNPTDSDVLSLMSQVALTDKDYDKATEILLQAIEEHPDNAYFYSQLARVEFAKEEFGTAEKYLDQGIKQIGLKRSLSLALFKIEACLIQGDTQGAEEQIEDLQKLNAPALQPIIDFAKAQAAIRKSQWTQAIKLLKGARSAMGLDADRRAKAGVLLGQCYEQLGKHDLALKVYKRVAADNPDMAAAASGVSRMKAKLNQLRTPEGNSIDGLVKRTLELPEEQQDWDRINEEVDLFLERGGFVESRSELIRANILVKRGLFTEARQAIKRAFAADPDDISVRLAAVRMLQLEPGSGPTRALELLDSITEKYGDNGTMRVLRADLIVSINDENLPQQLNALTTEMDDFQNSDQSRVWRVVGSKFRQIGQFDDARRCWNTALKLEPTNLPILMELFDLAMLENDEDELNRSQKLILDLVGDQRDPSYVVTNIKRDILEFGTDPEGGREKFKNSEKMLDAALKRRPEWHELHILKGQLAYLLRQDVTQALASFDQALKFGPPNLNAVTTQIKLLVEQQRFTEARERLEIIPYSVRTRLLGQAHAEILAKAGEKDRALQAARELLESKPDDGRTQKWYASVAAQLDAAEETEAALLRSAELTPNDPAIWTKLIRFYLQQRQTEKLDQTLRQARLALEAEYVPMVSAQHYEFLGQQREAEQIYQQVYEKQLDSTAVNRKMATFYSFWSRKDPSAGAKAAPYINRILAASYAGDVEPNHPDVLWARRQAARTLAGGGDYRGSRKARNLLQKSAVDGELSSTDLVVLSEILAAARDPASLVEAEQILTELRKRGDLPLQQCLLLCRIRDGLGRWDQADRLLLDLVNETPDNPAPWAEYVRLLVKNGEYTRANRNLERLEKIEGTEELVQQLEARLAAAEGDLKGLRKTLSAMLPKQSGKLDEESVKKLRSTARLAAELEDADLALQLYKLLIARDASAVLEFTAVVAQQGDPDDALKLIKSAFDDSPDAVLQIAVQMIRTRRDEIDNRLDADVDRLLAAALREDPDSAKRIILRAEAYDFQGKHDLAVAAYERVLERDDVDEKTLAACRNNLGYLLGLRGERLDEASGLIDQAMEVFGPISDVLDSRAVVNIAREDYPAAIEDLQLAVQYQPTASKYFHMAQALVLSGDAEGAREAWDRAADLGMEPALLHELERPDYKDIRDRIEAAESANAKL